MSYTEDSSPAAVIPPKRATNIRLWVVVGLALASTCAYLTRNALGTANTTIQGELGIPSETMGLVMAAFFLGYAWFQIPGGIVANRWGTRLILPLLAVAWSACGVWTGAAHSADSLRWSRFISGLAQAGLVPCSARAVRDWVPPAQHGLASSAVASSMTFGGVLAAALTAQLMPVLGWRGVFFTFSAVGVLWAVLFFVGFRNRPEEHWAVNESELQVIRGTATLEAKTAEKAETGLQVAAAMAASPTMWLLCLQAFCRAFGAVFFSTWFAAYLQKGRGMSVTDAGMLTVWPQMGILAGNLVGGVVVDRLLSTFGSKRISRCATSALALVLCAVALFLATLIPDARMAVLMIAVGSACFGIGSPAGWAAQLDVSGKHTATVFAVSNMAGNIGAMVCPAVQGLLIGAIERGAAPWNAVMYLLVAIYLLGAVFWAFLDPHRSAVGGPQPAAA
jgi:sugar phosphate permease